MRSGPARFLLAACLLVSLVFGSAFVMLHRQHAARSQAAVQMPENPLSDEETMQQVVAATRQFVGAGRLTGLNATYLLMSCQFDETPPYLGAVYVDFDVPGSAGTTGPDYLRTLATTMAGQGWKAGLPPNSHPGGATMTNNGITAVFFRNPDVRGKGVLQIQGECRNITDHRLDETGFVNITDKLN